VNAGPQPQAEPWAEWRLMPGSQIAALDREKTVIVVSVSPLEVHGPHLPTTTDIIEAEGLLRASVDLLHGRRPEIQFVHLPPLWVASDVLPHVGSIQFRPDTLRRVIDDLGRSLGRQGFKHVWISNFHGGPRHFGTLEVAAERASRRYGIRMVSMFSLLLARLTRDGGHELDHVLGDLEGVDPTWLKGDVHGGFIETSMMMSLIGRHVGSVEGLPPQTLDGWRIARGRAPGRRANPIEEFSDSYLFFFDHTYAGSPSGASAAVGARIIARLGGLAADALEDLWDGKVQPEQTRSPLWRWRHLVLNPWVGWAFERWNGAKNPVW